MVIEAVRARDRRKIRQCQRIADFQSAAASGYLANIAPRRHGIVSAGIIHPLGDFMRQNRNVKRAGSVGPEIRDDKCLSRRNQSLRVRRLRKVVSAKVQSAILGISDADPFFVSGLSELCHGAGSHTGSMVPNDIHLELGSLLFEGLDQIDLTGPFEVLSRLPNSTLRIFAKSTDPVRDVRGLQLAPDATLAEAPPLDLLHIPGGFGQEALMEDGELLDWIRRQASGARFVFSVCTGALICGAAGLLRGRRATTHWSAFHLLPYFGAIPVDERVVVDGNLISAAGVTAGIDGALRVAAELRGEEAAQLIQLQLQYAPEPPFHSGTLKPHPPPFWRKPPRLFARSRNSDNEQPNWLPGG